MLWTASTSYSKHQLPATSISSSNWRTKFHFTDHETKRYSIIITCCVKIIWCIFISACYCENILWLLCGKMTQWKNVLIPLCNFLHIQLLTKESMWMTLWMMRSLKHHYWKGYQCSMQNSCQSWDSIFTEGDLRVTYMLP